MTVVPRAWVLLTLGDDRQYAGNLGYEDDPTAVYRYDSLVPNHRQLAVGDTVILRDRTTILGSGIVESIDARPAVKARLACPDCDTTGIKERTTRIPRYRCNRGHEFDAPSTSDVACTAFVAAFGRTFVPVRDVIPPSAIRAAELRSSDQLSIRPIDLDRLTPDTLGSLGWTAWSPASVGSQPGVQGRAPAEDAPFAPRGADTRPTILRAIRARQGQARFRATLRSRYGDRCMITGCAAMDVVEAAHISPYRGTEDNHPENGLLLRADLHTLFDLDLLAVHPATLRVAVHSSIRPFGYEDVHGAPLRIDGTSGPSRSALRERWVRFEDGELG